MAGQQSGHKLTPPLEQPVGVHIVPSGHQRYRGTRLERRRHQLQLQRFRPAATLATRLLGVRYAVDKRLFAASAIMEPNLGAITYERKATCRTRMDTPKPTWRRWMPAPTVEDPAELIADKGYHSRDGLKDLEDGAWKSRMAEEKVSGVHRWHGDEAARRAVATTAPGCDQASPRKRSSSGPNWSSAASPSPSIAAACAAPGCAAATTCASATSCTSPATISA